jgi:hypothetical protein
MQSLPQALFLSRPSCRTSQYRIRQAAYSTISTTTRPLSPIICTISIDPNLRSSFSVPSPSTSARMNPRHRICASARTILLGSTFAGQAARQAVLKRESICGLMVCYCYLWCHETHLTSRGIINSCRYRLCARLPTAAGGPRLRPPVDGCPDRLAVRRSLAREMYQSGTRRSESPERVKKSRFLCATYVLCAERLFFNLWQ